MSEFQKPNPATQATIQGFEDPPKKCPRWAKWMGGSAIGLVILAAGAGYVATSMIDQQKYKALIVKKVEEQTGYKVDWSGDISVSVLPLPHAIINNLTLEANDQKILSIKEADIEVALWPLLSKKIQVKDIALDEPQVTLVTTKSGEQSWMTDQLAKKSGETADAGSDTAASSSSSSSSSSMDISVDVIEMTDGIFIWDDRSKGSKQILEDVDMRLKAESLNGPFELNGGMIANGRKVEAKITTPEIDTTSGKYPVQIKLALPESNIRSEYSGVITTKDQLQVQGDVSIEVTDLSSAIESLTGNAPDNIPQEFKGKTTLSSKVDVSPQRAALENLQVQVGELAYGGDFSVTGLDQDKQSPRISFDLKSNRSSTANASSLVKFFDDLSVKATGSIDGNVISINDSSFKLDDNEISLKGTVNNDESRTVDLIIAIKKFDIDQIRKKLEDASVASSGSLPGGSIGGGESATPQLNGFDLPFNGRIRADVNRIITGGKTYSDIQADLSSLNGALQITKMQAALPDGVTVNASGSIGNTKDLSGLDVAVKANIADAENLARTYGITLPDLPRKIGKVVLDGKFTGDLTALGFDTTIGAMGFAASGAGTVGTPMTNPVINKLQFSLKHSSFIDAIHIVQPGFSSSSGFEGPLDLSGQVVWGDDQYHLTELIGKLGKTSLSGEVDLAMSPKPSLSGSLLIGDLVLPQANNAKTSSSSQSASASGGSDSSKAKWSREAVDMSWMNKFNAKLTIKANSITQNLWKFTNANLAFDLKDGTLQIEDMSANMFGGSAAVNATIKNGAGDRDPLSITGNMKAATVNAQQLVSAVMGAPNPTISGQIDDVAIAINATGLSPAALIQTLSGKGTVSGSNLIVKGVDAAQLAMAAKGSYKPVDRAGTLFGSFGQGQTEFSTMDSAFDIQSGIVTFSKIDFDGPKATLNSTGHVNLPLWTIDLKNTMTIKDTDIPPFDFTIKGPLDNPSKAGGDVIENYLRGKFEKKVNKLIENKLNKLLGVQETQPPTDATTGTEGAAPETIPATPTPPATEKINPKDALKKDALKALGGLLGGQ